MKNKELNILNFNQATPANDSVNKKEEGNNSNPSSFDRIREHLNRNTIFYEELVSIILSVSIIIIVLIIFPYNFNQTIEVNFIVIAGVLVAQQNLQKAIYSFIKACLGKK